jgi:protein SCO1/2
MASLIRRGLLAALGVCLAGGAALGHEVEKRPAARPVPALAAAPAEPFPFAIGGAFELVDHRGRAVTDRDFRGAPMLVFFGYAGCGRICPVGLKRMVEALDLLGAAGARVQPVLVTVDPAHDTAEALAAYVPSVHPRLVGLTGSAEQLAAAAKAYRVDSKELGKSWDGKPVISHGSYVYLIDAEGRFATLLPPVLDAAAMARTIRKYL